MAWANSDETVTLEEVCVVRRTESSLLVEYEGEEFFIPFSEISDESEITEDSEPGDTGELIIPEWLAEDRGLV